LPPVPLLEGPDEELQAKANAIDKSEAAPTRGENALCTVMSFE
jgi:hypothetical protein